MLPPALYGTLLKSRSVRRILLSVPILYCSTDSIQQLTVNTGDSSTVPVRSRTGKSTGTGSCRRHQTSAVITVYVSIPVPYL